jgi:HEPN domain-containing protein
MFFAHLALEKLLKAHVCRQTKDLAPRIHNLVRLAELAALPLSPEQIGSLAELNAFGTEGRYPDQLTAPPSSAEAVEYMRLAREIFRWLMARL